MSAEVLSTVPDHVRLGVGARFTVVPAADDPVRIILDALAGGQRQVPEVEVSTDDVSSLVRGAERSVARYLTAVVTRVARTTPSGHVVATIALSRGCPGEVGCTLEASELVPVEGVSLDPVGVPAAAHWALYALGCDDTMGPIARAVDQARGMGTWTRAETFATRLDGDLAAVIGTLVDTWSTVGAQVAHVAAHATVSIASPTTAGGAR